MILPAGENLPSPFPDEGGDPPTQPRVLLVDDDERNLLALATVLEDLGEVVLARSGDEIVPAPV